MLSAASDGVDASPFFTIPISPSPQLSPPPPRPSNGYGTRHSPFDRYIKAR